MPSKVISLALLAMVCVSYVHQIRCDLVKGMLLGAMIAKQKKGDQIIVIPMYGREWDKYVTESSDGNSSESSQTTTTTVSTAETNREDNDDGDHHLIVLPLMTYTERPVTTSSTTTTTSTVPTITPRAKKQFHYWAK